MRSRDLQFAGLIGVAVAIASVGLLLSITFSERYGAVGALLVGLLVLAIIAALTPLARIAGPLCGVALAWFALVPALDVIYPSFDQGEPPISFVVWSWAVAALIALALLRAPWAAWRRRPTA